MNTTGTDPSATHPFDEVTLESLRAKNCMKWTYYDADVLPLWVADMDFPPADVIANALAERAQGGNLGYPAGYLTGEPGLREALVAWLAERHDWRVEEDDIWPLHGIIPGLYLGALTCASAGEGVLLQTPLYPPFMAAVQNTGRTAQYSPLVWSGSRWEMDLEGLEAAITPETRLLMICNPQNPTGRVFERTELEALADIVLRHRLWVVSDELHSDLVYSDLVYSDPAFPGARHIPFASLSDELAQRTLTLLGPTKSFNIAGLKIGFLVTQNAALLDRLKQVGTGLVTPPNVMAQTAALAAYTQGGPWLAGALDYLKKNRDRVGAFAETYLPGSRYAAPEGTYLAWLELGGLGLGDALYGTLLGCGVGLNEGPPYGPGGEGFARLNFATTEAVVAEALERLKTGLNLG